MLKRLPVVFCGLGLLLLLVSVAIRIKGGLLFSARGTLEFTQTIFLLSISVGVVYLCRKKG